MATHIKKNVAHCGRCILYMAPDPPRAPMKSFSAKELMELLAIDFLSIRKERVDSRTFWLSQTASVNSHGHSPP